MTYAEETLKAKQGKTIEWSAAAKACAAALETSAAAPYSLAPPYLLHPFSGASGHSFERRAEPVLKDGPRTGGAGTEGGSRT